ncbi:MAG: alkaline phosphatase family protein [Candidatus Dadabacteria bacterium]|nr:alkaline phosphatase family protein [Candidatus Dadabacteria bacterium]
MTEFKSCIFIMADGARADVFSELLNSGDLPNISKYIVEKGCYKEAVTVFPSTTGPAYTPYIFGKYPGRCNLPGIRWLDRDAYNDKLLSFDRFRSYIGLETYFMNRDVSLDYQTLFEIFPRNVNIFNELSRGAGFKNDKTLFSKLYYKVKSHFTDKSDEVDLVARRILLQSLKEYPDFIYAVFLGIDTYSHLNHPFHKKVINSYRRIDEMIGLLAKNLESEGRLEETLIIVASDHGLTQTHSHFDSLEFMNDQGYKTFYYPNVFKHFTDADAACLISGNAMANIYVKSKDGWGRKSTFEELVGLVDNFIERPEVDIVAGLDHKGRSRIKSTMGEAVTWLDNDGNINYQKIKGDPFNYNGMPKKMSSEEALAYSFNTEYPDALLQIIQLLESPRTGDLILSAGPGYDLRAKHENPEHRSSHGALFRDHMLVPLVMNAKVNKEFIRTVDIFPTILSFLGQPIPNNIDGISLVD